ncbi:transporter [Pseudomonas chlororaphis subsp. aurantiaca PB-St2]|nr:transporter [Pseudomonas chlororaphis subsp. aurantiaca PB-St2]
MGVSALSLGLNTARPAQAKSSPAELKNAVPESEIRALFSQAVLQALHINPKINSSRLQAEAAQSSIDEAKGQRWPQLNVSSNSRSLNFGSGYRRDNGNDDPVSLSVNVATTLYDFGQTSHTIKTREAQAEAATLTVSAESESTAWDVSSALTELSKQRLLIAISEDYVARMKELTKMLQGIVAVDQGRQSELTQAKGRLLSAESQLDAAVAKSRDTEIVLTRLLGESSISLPSASQWRLRLPDPQSQLSKVETHPTVLKAIADKQAAESEAAVVRASGLPTFSWVVSKNTGQDELGRRQAYETGIQMSWGLFRGGSTRAAERAALARAEASRYLVEDQQRDLEQRIRAANQDASSLLERSDLYQSLTAETDRIRTDFFDQWYHLGKRTLLDVLSAESDYYNNRVSEVSSRFDGYAAIIRSYASSGTLVNWLNNRSFEN